MAFLEISGLRKRFGALEILKGIDLTLEKGGFLVLVGPSGCGKSTLLNTIAGLESISSGEIRIEGDSDQRSAPLEARHRDGVPVLRALSEHDGGARTSPSAWRCAACRRPSATRRSPTSPRRCRSSICSTRRPSQLSGGQRQRVAMGRALVRQPRVFLFDEPLSNLDAKLRVDMRVEIKRLHQQTGATIVYVTHDQIEAMTLATRIAVLKDGELQQVGTPERDLQHAGQSVRRRLHGLAGDEPARGQGLARERRAPGSCSSATDHRADRRSRRRRAPTSSKLADGAQGHLRHPPGGGQRPRERRPQREVGRDLRRQCRDRRAGRLGHFRRHPYRRQGGDGADARRRRRARRARATPSPSTSTRRCCSIRRRRAGFDQATRIGRLRAAPACARCRRHERI